MPQHRSHSHRQFIGEPSHTIVTNRLHTQVHGPEQTGDDGSMQHEVHVPSKQSHSNPGSDVAV
jgi:hypothetical protein